MPSVSSKRLYIRGLRKDVTEEELSKYLVCYGKITEVKLLPNYAFVQFESEKDALVVLKTYQDQPLLGNNIVIEFAHRLRKDMPSITSCNSSDNSHSPSYRNTFRHPVVVLDIPRDVRWQELKDFGRLSGRLVAYCDLDRTQQGRGFIEYFTRQDARRAIIALDGKRLGGKNVRVIDHEAVQGLQSHSRRRSRSRSPKRRSTSHYSRNAGYTAPYDEYGAVRRPTYIYAQPLTEQDYDCGERRYTMSPYLPNSQDQREYDCRPFVDNDDAEGFERISSWTATHHDYYQGYEYLARQHPDDVYYGQRNSGYGGNSIHRDYHLQRPMDPYQ